MIETETAIDLTDLGKRARAASYELAKASTGRKNADALVAKHCA